MEGSVSVVMAAWNAAPFVAEALRSVLDQTASPAEIVVVDDGSTDDTAAIAAGFAGVTVVRQEHAGIAPARNAGLAHARGDFLALLDADDVWLPAKLERQLAAFADDPTREAVFSRFDEFGDIAFPPPPGTRRPLSEQGAPLPSGLVVPRRIADRIGAFAEGSNVDWIEWLARLRALGVVEYVLPEVLFRRRIHDRNSSFLQRDDGRSLVAVAHQHRRRIRAQRDAATEVER